jgi:hypothetical protein
MNKRDRAILESLKQFRVLDRDQLISLHFGDVKDSVSSCNKVLKRLQRDGHLTCDQSRRPYLYFPNPMTIKKNSGKIPHFQSIADFVIEAKQLGRIREFEVEVKLGEKGTVEPDLFMLWEGTPFFVEIQRNHFSPKQMKAKMERYGAYHYSNDWKELWFQRPEKKFFPYVLIITDQVYNIEKQSFGVFQAKSMTDFVQRYVKKKKDS